MSSGSKKPPFSRQSSYNSLYANPLVEPKRHGRSCSEGVAAVVPLGDCLNLNLNRTPLASKDHNKEIDNNNNNVVVLDKRENPEMGDKENAAPATGSFPTAEKFATLKSMSTGRANPEMGDKENAVPATGSFATAKKFATLKSMSTGRALKPTSLEYCMQMNEPKLPFGSKTWDVSVGSEKSNSVNIWDYSDSEAAPASSWATLPNRALLCRPLPLDVGRCTCVIVKESTPEGLNGGALYSLYTNEGKGRQDRKLAVAHHKQHKGRSEFTIAQTTKGLLSCSDDSYIGTVTANFMGSKYHIWDQGSNLNSSRRKCKPLLAVVRFMPTIATWTGSYRSMSVYVPKHQSMQLRSSTTQVQHINGLPKDWEDRKDRVHQLCSRVPHYNKISNQYELDYRDRGRAGLQIQRSVKNFQLTLEESGKQTILQLGRVEKSKYVMDYRYPLTGYQAFCICLASIDSKLCCTI